VDVGQAKVAAAVAVRQHLAIDPHEVDGREELVHVRGFSTALNRRCADLPFYGLFRPVAVWVGILSPLIVTYPRTLWHRFDRVVTSR